MWICIQLTQGQDRGKQQPYKQKVVGTQGDVVNSFWVFRDAFTPETTFQLSFSG